MKKKDTKTNDLMQKIRKAKNDTARRIGFTEYAYLWLEVYKAPPKVRATTYELIKNAIDNRLTPFFGAMPMADISPMDIELYRNSLSDVSPAYQRKCLLYLRNILDTAVDNGLIEKSPLNATNSKIPTDKKEAEEPLTNDQAKRLLKSVEGTRAYPFVLIALSTGMRRGEILGLMWEDVDFRSGFITVTHQKAYMNKSTDSEVTTMLKTDSANRRIPMSKQLRDYLWELYQQTDSKFVIHMRNGDSLTRASYRSLWNIVEMREVGNGRPMGSTIPGSRIPGARVCLDFHTHPHLLRHTFCTQCIEAGMEIKEVQYLMGHATPDITMRIYAHYRQKCRESDTAEKMRNAISYLG